MLMRPLRKTVRRQASSSLDRPASGWRNSPVRHRSIVVHLVAGFTRTGSGGELSVAAIAAKAGEEGYDPSNGGNEPGTDSAAQPSIPM